MKAGIRSGLIRGVDVGSMEEVCNGPDGDRADAAVNE